MGRKATKKAAAATVQSDRSEAEKPAFVPCRQCGNTGDCARAGACKKGFK